VRGFLIFLGDRGLSFFLGEFGIVRNLHVFGSLMVGILGMMYGSAI
jgi:hypothetical protein